MPAHPDLDFEFPYPSRSNPHENLLYDHVLAWGKSTGLITTEVGRRRMSACRLDLCAAFGAPTLGWDGVSLIAELLEWAGRLDDQVDEGPLRRNPHLLAQVLDEFRTVLATGNSPRPSPALNALTDLWRRLSADTPTDWHQHVTGQLNYYFDGYLWEATYQGAGIVPDLMTYNSLHRSTSLVHTMLALTDHFKGVGAVEKCYRSPVYQTLRDAAIDIINWANDLISFDKEAVHDQYTNHLVSRTRTEASTLRASTAELRSSIKQRIQALVTGAHHLPALLRAQGIPDTTAAAHLECIRTLQEWTRGSLDYYGVCGRYPSGGKEERQDFAYLTEQDFFALEGL